MNSLSWILYLADAASKLSVIAATATIVGGIFAAILLVVYLITSGFASGGDEDALKFATFIRPVAKWFAFVVVGFGLVYAVVPSSSTLYLIAASEAGEAVVTAPGTKELFGDLTAVIKKRLKEELGE